MNEVSDASAMDVVRAVLANNSGGRVTRAAIHDELRIAQDLGIDSLKFILVILEIEEALGRKIFDVSNVKSVATAGDLYRLVNAAPGPASMGRS
jgi:acyl carrier protein